VTDALGIASTRCGFVAIVGGPNVGKSTLVNRLVGTKVSIVSPKPQTTRMRVLGIVMRDRSQIVLVDTPGLFQPRRTMDRAMVAAAWTSMADADVVAVMIDSTKGFDAPAREVAAWLRARDRQALLLFNKIDAVAKPALLSLAAMAADERAFSRILMISATTGDGVDDLVGSIEALLPAGPWLYPADEVSDLPEAVLATEITREQVFWQLHEELPYAVAVTPETWTAQADGSVRIEQTIIVERASQRAIVIGRQGQRIREIGERSRKQLERLLDRRVHLLLHVKVREKWQDDPAFLTRHRLDPKP
jgi:GTP-binding protein Era